MRARAHARVWRERERVAGFVWECVGCVLLCLLGLLAGHEKAQAERKVTDPGMGIFYMYVYFIRVEFHFSI